MMSVWWKNHACTQTKCFCRECIFLNFKNQCSKTQVHTPIQVQAVLSYMWLTLNCIEYAMGTHYVRVNNRNILATTLVRIKTTHFKRWAAPNHSGTSEAQVNMITMVKPTFTSLICEPTAYETCVNFSSSWDVLLT